MSKTRHSIRLKDYDYSRPGAYFVTICTHNRECLFGEISKSHMVLNKNGEIVNEEWTKSPDIRTEIRLDSFVVMPNHFHGIVYIEDTRANSRSPLQQSRVGMGSETLSSMIAGFKSAVTKQIKQINTNSLSTVWQRNYYEHIIRDESELDQIREYIANNPLKWQEDKYYTAGAA